MKELQKTAILGTAHILRKVLTKTYNRVNEGTSDIDIINSNDRIAETLYSLGTWFISGIYKLIPYIKEIMIITVIISIIIVVDYFYATSSEQTVRTLNIVTID